MPWKPGAGGIKSVAMAIRAPIGFDGRYLPIPSSHNDSPMPLARDDFWVRMLQDLTQDRDRARLALARTMSSDIGVYA